MSVAVSPSPALLKPEDMREDGERRWRRRAGPVSSRARMPHRATPPPASLRNLPRVSVLFIAISPGISRIIQEVQDRPFCVGGTQTALREIFRGRVTPPGHPESRSRSEPFRTTFPLEPGSPSSGSWVISISG